MDVFGLYCDTGEIPSTFALRSVNASTTAVTQYLYDQCGDLVQTTAPSGLVTKYTYDEIGRKKTETQISDTYPAGVTTTYDYDQMSRVAAITGPLTPTR